MVDAFANLALGFSVAFSPQNLLYCFGGTLLGTVIGVLPGLGPATTIAMLIPITFYLNPTSALIMLAGIYYGAQYGGSTTAILMRIPGEASSVVTAIDGYQLARKGRAGAALAIAAISSFIAGIIATVVIAAAAPLLATVVLQFGAPEYFSLIVLGLTSAIVLAGGSAVKAVGMLALGLFLGTVGTDVNSGTLRFTFGVTELFDGINFIVVAMAFFGIDEAILNVERSHSAAISIQRVGSLWPTRAELKAALPAALRGTGIGSILGVLPGGGAVLASFAAYVVEKKIARDPSRFGQGAIEAVAGPEAANNAGAQTSFIPMLTLGLPSNVVMALMIGAMTIQGIHPGPQIIEKQPELFWGVVVSMLIGNLMLVILNLPLVGIWVKFLSIPYRLLYPGILLLCCIGVYSVQNQSLDLLVCGVFSVAAYFLAKIGCEPAPLLIGMVLSPLMEENFRRALLLSDGNPTVFFTEPISLGLLLTTVALIGLMVLPTFRKKRDVIFEE